MQDWVVGRGSLGYWVVCSIKKFKKKYNQGRIKSTCSFFGIADLLEIPRISDGKFQRVQEELCGGLRWQQRHRRLEGKKQNDRRSPFASTRQTSIHLFLACKHVATVLQTLASVRRHIRHVEGGEAVKRCVVSLQAKFCSTVANDIMLDTGVGVVRMWADETSRLSRFRMLFTSFADRESFLPVAINLCHSAFVFRRTWSHVVARGRIQLLTI